MNRLIPHRTFIRYIKWRWLIRLLYRRKRGWEFEVASDDLLSEKARQHLKEEFSARRGS